MGTQKNKSEDAGMAQLLGIRPTLTFLPRFLSLNCAYGFPWAVANPVPCG